MKNGRPHGRTRRRKGEINYPCTIYSVERLDVPSSPHPLTIDVHHPPQAWLRHFNAVKSAHDNTSAKMALAVLVAWTPLMVSGRGPAIFAALFAVSSLAILAAMRQPWYAAWRELVINCRQMFTIISYCVFVMRSKPFQGFLTPPTATTWYFSLRSLMLLPLMVLSMAASYTTPVRSKRYIVTATLAACVPANAMLCHAAAAVHGAARYRDILAIAEAAAHRIFPIQAIDIVNVTGRALFDAPALSEFGACMAVHTTLQTAIGFVLPLSVLLAEESVSRAAYDRSRLGGTGAAYKLRYSTALHLVLALLEAAVAFHAIVRVLHVLGMVGLVPTLTKSLF